MTRMRRSSSRTAIRKVFARICEGTPDGFPITVFYAFKQAETDDDGDHASTGWETLLEGMLAAGWTVTGTWPIRTELANRTAELQSNALASSIVLACRPRPADAGFTDRRGLIAALREEFPEALRKLQQGKHRAGGSSRRRRSGRGWRCSRGMRG